MKRRRLAAEQPAYEIQPAAALEEEERSGKVPMQQQQQQQQEAPNRRATQNAEIARRHGAPCPPSPCFEPCRPGCHTLSPPGPLTLTCRRAAHFARFQDEDEEADPQGNVHVGANNVRPHVGGSLQACTRMRLFVVCPTRLSICPCLPALLAVLSAWNRPPPPDSHHPLSSPASSLTSHQQFIELNHSAGPTFTRP